LSQTEKWRQYKVIEEFPTRELLSDSTLLKGEEDFDLKDIVIGKSVNIAPTVSYVLNGKKTVIGNNVTIGAGTVMFGGCVLNDNVFVGHNAVLREGTKLRKHVIFGSLSVSEGDCIIEEHTLVHSQCHITKYTYIGPYCFIAPFTVFSNDKEMMYRRRGHGENLEGVILGKGVRVGVSCIFLPGVEVGDYAVIGAGSLVTKDVPPGRLWYGHPAEDQGSASEEEVKVCNC